MLKTEIQFQDEGCENWGVVNEGNDDIQNYTTKNYSGLIAMMDSANSWVAKYQGLQPLYPGVYAIDIKAEYEE